MNRFFFKKTDFIVYTRFGYLDFRQNFLKHSSLGAILSRILCRIQIWASKIGLPTGQNSNIKKKTKNSKKYQA